SEAIHAAMLAREARSGSLGCHSSPGRALAKQTTCSPVPEPISRAKPLLGRTVSSTSRIGLLLRPADGENCRPSLLRSRFSRATGGGVSDFAILQARMEF